MTPSNRLISKHRQAKRRLGRVFVALVAFWAAPYGFGTGLWRRRDHRWRQARVARLFAGYGFAFLAWAFAPLGAGPGFWGRRGERWKHRRLQRLMEGYLRALVAWALEPYRPGVFDLLDDGQWFRRGTKRGLGLMFGAVFAWASSPLGVRRSWEFLVGQCRPRQLLASMAMTMVAATAMAFGSGPAFHDGRDEAEHPAYLANNATLQPGEDAATSDDQPVEHEGVVQGAGRVAGPMAPRASSSQTCRPAIRRGLRRASPPAPARPT